VNNKLFLNLDFTGEKLLLSFEINFNIKIISSEDILGKLYFLFLLNFIFPVICDIGNTNF
jgi:hypothetical protein